LLRAFVTTAPRNDDASITGDAARAAATAAAAAAAAGAGGGGAETRRRDTRHPAMCANVTPGGLHFRIHEPTIWRLADFHERLRLGRMSQAAAAAAATTNLGGGGGGGGQAGTKAAAAEDPVMLLGGALHVGIKLTHNP
jgi:hypothetical protein